MNALVIVGLLLNCVAFSLGLVELAEPGSVYPDFPSWLRTLQALVLSLSLLPTIVGVVLIWRFKQPLGSICLIGASILYLPLGLFGVIGGVVSLRDYRAGMHLGGARDKDRARRPRPRSWTIASAIFALLAVSAALLALVMPWWLGTEPWYRVILTLSSLLLALLTGFEAFLLWYSEQEAYRLGTGLALTGLAMCALAGFYLHSYVAVSLLAVPIYAAFLLRQGKPRWEGLPGRVRS